MRSPGDARGAQSRCRRSPISGMPDRLAFVVIGGAFLAVTGGEAFYADMGHFGPLPIRVAWFGVALPALTLNYFGQGGLLLAEPHSRRDRQSVLRARPAWAHYPAHRACDRRHRHRLAVDHLRRLFDDAAGDQPGLSAAHERRPYRRPGDRPDLCAVRQLGAGGRHARRGHRLRLVGRAGGRLRHRGVAADGDHDADGDLRRAALEAQPSDRLPGQRQPARARPRCSSPRPRRNCSTAAGSRCSSPSSSRSSC